MTEQRKEEKAPLLLQYTPRLRLEYKAQDGIMQFVAISKEEMDKSVISLNTWLEECKILNRMLSANKILAEGFYMRQVIKVKSRKKSTYQGYAQVNYAKLSGIQ